VGTNGEKPAEVRRRKSGLIEELPTATVAHMFENCVGCKWTLHILAQIRAGVNRPGALVRSKTGLTTKVLNQRLVKLVGYGILQKKSYAEIPPRVEYDLTPFGRRFLEILDQVEDLRREFDDGRGAGR
jgi:DNA-binding HxlR family transcriptional regulator